MTYIHEIQKFTALESSKLSKALIDRIVSDDDDMGWRPEVLHEVDQNGNWLLGLVTVASPFSQISRTIGGCFYRRRIFKGIWKVGTFIGSQGVEWQITAEIFFGEAGFTNAKDRKPILATCECVFGLTFGKDMIAQIK